MVRSYVRGWYGESHRHYLASKGVRSSFKSPRYFAKGNREGSVLKSLYAQGYTKQELGVPYAQRSKPKFLFGDERTQEVLERERERGFSQDQAFLPPQPEEVVEEPIESEEVGNIALSGAPIEAPIEAGEEEVVLEEESSDSSRLPGQDVGASVIETSAAPPLFARKWSPRRDWL